MLDGLAFTSKFSVKFGKRTRSRPISSGPLFKMFQSEPNTKVNYMVRAQSDGTTRRAQSEPNPEVNCMFKLAGRMKQIKPKQAILLRDVSLDRKTLWI